MLVSCDHSERYMMELIAAHNPNPAWQKVSDRKVSGCGTQQRGAATRESPSRDWWVELGTEYLMLTMHVGSSHIVGYRLESLWMNRVLLYSVNNHGSTQNSKYICTLPPEWPITRQVVSMRGTPRLRIMVTHSNPPFALVLETAREDWRWPREY
ncbi:hypothetical protein P167DRAFT_569042 [Morchella conica CCBAS932]|uniref:Uncharacterized protein n=1 Tax=Morchella conica CCBAS932 TaxID=1392247 RepID=A0A3N4K808_9PEZI|nr:hypothetical protein P167DRAFT_569042 [Morchella conica CCBAS932]